MGVHNSKSAVSESSVVPFNEKYESATQHTRFCYLRQIKKISVFRVTGVNFFR